MTLVTINSKIKASSPAVLVALIKHNFATKRIFFLIIKCITEDLASKKQKNQIQEGSDFKPERGKYKIINVCI